MSKKHRGRYRGDAVTYQLPSPAGGVQLETFVPWTLVKRGLRKQIIGFQKNQKSQSLVRNERG